MLNLYFYPSPGISILDDAVVKPSNSRVKGTALYPTSPVSDVIIVDSFVSGFNTELPTPDVSQSQWLPVAAHK